MLNLLDIPPRPRDICRNLCDSGSLLWIVLGILIALGICFFFAYKYKHHIAKAKTK